LVRGKVVRVLGHAHAVVGRDGQVGVGVRERISRLSVLVEEDHVDVEAPVVVHEEGAAVVGV